MSTKKQRQKQNRSTKVGSSAKSKGASLPTPLDGGGAGNAVKGRDERQHRAPLTAFPAHCPRTSFFRLTWPVVVIDTMTLFEGSEIFVAHAGQQRSRPPGGIAVIAR